MDRVLAENYYRLGFEHGHEPGGKYNFDTIYGYDATSPTTYSSYDAYDYPDIGCRRQTSESHKKKIELETIGRTPAYESSFLSLSDGPENQSISYQNFDFTDQGSRGPTSGLLCCLYGPCCYQTKSQYDLDRHTKTHYPSDPSEKFDCPGRGCGRTGEHGFDRKDHLREHLRKTHAKDIPRQGRRRSKHELKPDGRLG